MLEGGISSPLVNIFTLSCGILLGYIFKDWFRKNIMEKRTSNETAMPSNADESVMEENFSNVGIGDYKLILVVQNGLKMGKGKIAAQCSHASVMAYKTCMKRSPDMLHKWLLSGQRKVVLKVEDEKTLLELANEARRLNLIVSLVSDAGRTQIPAGSRTVIGIGPGPEIRIDEVTKSLKLL